MDAEEGGAGPLVDDGEDVAAARRQDPPFTVADLGAFLANANHPHHPAEQRRWLAKLVVDVDRLEPARDAKGLLIGEPARYEERQRLRRTILEHDAVEDVLDLRTMYLGPQSLLVVARVDLRDELDGAAVDRVAAEIDEALREELPDVTEVFLDPTSGPSATSAA